MLTGINDFNAGEVQIYSNNNLVFIQADESLNGEVYIYDMLGQEILQQKANGENRMQLTINSGTGYYLVELHTMDGILTGKVFIK